MYMGTRCGRAILLGMLILSSCLAWSQGAMPQHAHVSLISDASSFKAGTSPVIGLRFQLDPGWHIYWKNPGDSGEPPKIAWKLPKGIQAGSLHFPIPHRIQDHGLTDFGYEGDVVLLTTLTVGEGFASNQAQIAGDVRYLVCREVCIPGKDTVTLSSSTAENAVLIRNAKSRLPQPMPAKMHVSAAVDSDKVTLRITGPTSILQRVTDFIPAEPQIVENSTKPAIKLLPGALSIRLKKSEQLAHPISELRGLLIAEDRAYEVQVRTVSDSSSSSASKAKRK
jgi:DsbC/DsbD-like thiol-disulfide interchange protein